VRQGFNAVGTVCAAHPTKVYKILESVYENSAFGWKLIASGNLRLSVSSTEANIKTHDLTG
jgi:hypothetical protein